MLWRTLDRVGRDNAEHPVMAEIKLRERQAFSELSKELRKERLKAYREVAAKNRKAKASPRHELVHQLAAKQENRRKQKAVPKLIASAMLELGQKISESQVRKILKAR